ncbi:queuosine salvage protein isoform X1 [Macrosteles quadrilineatus]|uniref:queuosine salvage protein isoform X1 n=1 Tax=Macrosteles quadrilineatus TaxID=74068 RepID=UPI0023E1C4DE|nr:queuosine salvage protein isoform X1 [Macrosteles quadrilineatus]
MAISPRESGKYISKLSKNVQICNSKISDLSEKILEELVAGKISPGGFSSHPCHPAATEAALNWILLVDTLNFCFWSHNGAHWEVQWKGETYTGYFALCAAVNRAVETGVDATDPKVYSQWSLKDLEHILRGDNGIQLMLLEERLQCVQEVGKKLLDKYKGNFVNCVKQCEGSAQSLLKLIVTEFPCFRDEADYNGERVSFYKRAQILVGDVWSCFEGKGLGVFNDIDSLTMFADYRVPQVLVYFGVLEYSKGLNKKLNEGDFLPNGSVEEVEIRGCSIEAVERLKTKVDEQIKDSGKHLHCNSVLIDHFLWSYRRSCRAELDKIPFHKTICIYY